MCYNEKMKTIDFKIADDKCVKLYHWDDVENAKGVVQIIHGLAEHTARYTKFAKFLNKNGWHVFGNDLRGCGFNVEKGKLGWDEGNMWENDLSDQLRLTEYIKILFPELPVAVLGHCYGSFLAQAYLPKNNKASAFILSGSKYAKGGWDMFWQRSMANMQFSRHGDYKRGKLLYDLTFSAYQYDFKDNGSWLTSDEAEIEKYGKDIRCNFKYSTNFYKWYYAGLKTLYKKKARAVDTDLPLMIFSGSDDASSKYGKGVTKLYEYYQKLGMNNIEFKLYDGGRHEMLNEVNREEVYADVLGFLGGI